MPTPDKLDRHEEAALLDIAKRDCTRPFFWRRKSMPKLAAKGLVRAHPNDARGYQTTVAGEQLAKELRLLNGD